MAHLLAYSWVGAAQPAESEAGPATRQFRKGTGLSESKNMSTKSYKATRKAVMTAQPTAGQKQQAPRGSYSVAHVQADQVKYLQKKKEKDRVKESKEENHLRNYQGTKETLPHVEISTKMGKKSKKYGINRSPNRKTSIFELQVQKNTSILPTMETTSSESVKNRQSSPRRKISKVPLMPHRILHSNKQTNRCVDRKIAVFVTEFYMVLF